MRGLDIISKTWVYFRHRNGMDRIMFWKGHMESHMDSRSQGREAGGKETSWRPLT